MTLELLIVLALMALNGLFAAAEIAVLSVRKTRLAELVDDGSASARAVLWLRRRPERFLATVQIGITVVGTTAAAFGGDSLAEHFARSLAEHAPWLGASAPRIAFVLVIALISTLEIVVGELIPKSLALRHAERVSVTLGPMLRAMASVVKPVVWLLTGLSNVVLRFFGDRTSFSESRLSPEEIQELVEEAGRTGAIDAGTSEIASRAIDLRELTAADVMVPRSAIIAIDRAADVATVRAVLTDCRFSRLPIYERDPENIVGHVAIKDLVLPALDGHPLAGATIYPARFVPGTTAATTLLQRMQREQLSMVMVIDELGELLGLVTVSDLLAELVGDILGEDDPAPTTLAREPDGSAVLPGETPIRDVNRALAMGLPEPHSVTTVAGLCLEAAGRMPAEGERFLLADGHEFEVLAATPRKINTLRVRPPKSTPASTDLDDE